MRKTFFSVNQGDLPPFGSLAGKGSCAALIDPPVPFFATHPGALMSINPLYKDVPFIQEKLKVLKHLIKIGRATIATWEAQEPDYPLLIEVKEELKRSEKLLKEITGGQPCQ